MQLLWIVQESATLVDCKHNVWLHSICQIKDHANNRTIVEPVVERFMVLIMGQCFQDRGQLAIGTSKTQALYDFAQLGLFGSCLLSHLGVH